VQRAGAPGRSAVGDAQETCAVCALSKLDDPATRIGCPRSFRDRGKRYGGVGWRRRPTV